MKAAKEKEGYGFQPFSIGTLNGFTTTEGVEGSGQDVYYFIVSPSKTLVVSRTLIPEFGSINGDRQTYLNLPGIIPPNQADQYFTKILSSLCTEYTRNGSMGSCKQPTATTANWRIYNHARYEFEIQYPVGSQINDGLGRDSNSPGISFTLPDSSSGQSRIFYVYVATKAWYNLGTPNGVFKSPANCDDFGSKTTTSVNINGINFVKGDVSSAATAQRSNATEYCFLKGDTAYKLTPSILYSRNNVTYNGFDPDIDVNGDPVLNQMLSSFKFTPTTSATIEKASGIIKSVYNKSGKNYIDIDYVEFVTGGPNGNRTLNSNSQIRTLAISPSAKFNIESTGISSITFQDFANLFIPTGIVNGVSIYNYQKGNPWDIVIINGVVTQITEHFVP